MTLNKKTNQKGFTLVSTMVAVGIAAVVILGLGTVLTQMFQVLRGAESAGEGNDIITQMRLNFDDPDMCDAAMGTTHSFTADGGATANSLSGLNLSIHGTLVPFNVGAEIQPGLVLKSMDLLTITKAADKQAISVQTSGASPTTAYRYQGLVRVQLTRTVGGKSMDQTPSFIPVTFTSNNGTSIASCGSTALSQSTCEALNYVWDATAKKCIQANECSYGGSYSDAGGNPGDFVNAFTGGHSCPADAQGNPYDQVRTGSFSYATKSGKYDVESHIYPVVSCMICKDANGKKTAFSASTLSAINNLIAGQSVVPDIPSGSYTQSCSSCTYDDSTKVLNCQCKTTTGAIKNTTLNTTSCAGDISNINGSLACMGNCASKTGSGSGLASYGCYCAGNASCLSFYYYGSINYCIETCADGSHWYQYFTAAGVPSGSATHY